MLSMANFRPLQPAPMDEQQHSLQARLPLAQKPKRTVTLGACVACRKRKSKCDGNRPICSCCTQKDTQCVYELGPNEKPSQAMKRKNAEMQDELSNLRQVYELLRFRPEHEALAILRQIRSEPSGPSSSQDFRNLVKSARQGQLSSDSSPIQRSESTHSLTLPPLRFALGAVGSDQKQSPPKSRIIFPAGFDEPSSQRRRYASDAGVSAHSDTSRSIPSPTSIEALLQPDTVEFFDDRLRAIINWTTVSKDTQFLTNLMSLWHKWEHIYFHYLDWDIFLDDLSSGRTNFCSELLVNSLLASASFHSSLVKNRSTPFGDSIATRFYREARKLWETGEGEDDCLTRIQAALALWGVFARHAQDKVGLLFLQEACRIAQRIGLFQKHSNLHASQRVPQDKWERIRAVTAWGLFNLQMTISLTCSLPPLLTTPPLITITHEDTSGTEDLFRDECSRSTILAENMDVLMSSYDILSKTPIEPEHIEDFYYRIKFWFEHRRSSLCPAKYPSPENILAAMLYHSSVMRVYRPFAKHDSSDEIIRSYSKQARARTLTAMAELRQLILLYESEIGWKSSIAMILHPLFMFVFASLEELSERNHSFLPESNQDYQGLLICLRALSTISTYNFYAQLLFRLVTSSCQSLNIPLPMEIVGVMTRFQSDEWTKNAASTVRSMYVVDLRSTATDDETARMDSIISCWNALTIKGQRKTPKD